MRLIKLLTVFTLVTASILLAGDALAQQPQAVAQGLPPPQRPSTAQLQKAMQRLDWMIGKWEGSGWDESAKVGRREFFWSLDVRTEFEGLLLIVDGVGYAAADKSVSYAEQLLISGPTSVRDREPPGPFYIWQQFGRGIYPINFNDAQEAGRSLSVGLPILLEDCDRIVAESYRTFCRTGSELLWSRTTMSINDRNEWVETREWQDNEADHKWHEFFKVVLRRVKQEGP